MATSKVTELKAFVDCFPGQPIYLGADVHKNSYHIAILRGDGQMRTLVLPANAQAVLQLIRNIGAPLGALAYESGPTGFVLARALAAEDLPVIVAAASRIPRAATPGAKTDRLDCRRLAQFAAKGLLKPIAIPTEEQEAERTLVRRRDQLRRDLRCCRQRIKSLLLEFNVSEPAGLKNWSKRAVAALDKVPLPAEAMFTLQSHLIELQFLLTQRDSMMQHLEEISKKADHERVMECLRSVPGVGPQVAAAFRLEVFQPERFRSSGELTSYLGLAPMVRQSGEGKGHSRLRPAGKCALRALLIEAAWTFRRKDPQARAFYNKLLGRHGLQQKALAAVARKLAVLLWRLCLEQRPYELRTKSEMA